MRKQKAIKNILFSFALEIITIGSNLIVPKLIIQTYGSVINGLINSIGSFIGYISLLQLGVGSVIKAALYKPLAQKDKHSLNIILKTTEKFFLKLGVISAIYIFLLAFFFPLFIAKELEFLLVFLLVLILGLSTISEYLFGITYQMLLEADQKSYIFSSVQIITLTINTIGTILLIKSGASILLVKLFCTILFVIRPFVIYIYVKQVYKIDRTVITDKRIISQRWDGFAHGLAFFIHSKTDIFVLTVFSTMQNVSVYSVYALVTSGLSSIITCIDKAIRAALGNIAANKEEKNLKSSYEAYSSLLHIFSCACFATAAITISSFIKVYVKNVIDADYDQPVFSIIIITAELLYCLRMPYNSIIVSIGHFKQTKRASFIEAGVNIFLSVLFIRPLGLIGIAIGTLVGMIYKTCYYIYYLHNNILYISYKDELLRYVSSLLGYLLCIVLFSNFNFKVNGVLNWLIYAVVIVMVSFLTILLINIVMRKKQTKALFKKIIK